MARKASKKPRRRSRRTRLVWISFLVAAAVATGVLALGDRAARPGFPATRAALIEPSSGGDPILRVDEPLARDRWHSIVIHDSGEPAGDAESIRRRHVGYGYRMMGYHFLVGNGNGMGDGVIHVGERWIKQVAGWHAVGPEADRYNGHAIAICLIGSGDRRAVTDRQMTQLVALVRRLQWEFSIPSSEVRLHRDIAPGLTSSPGRYFPVADFERRLLEAR